MLAVVLAMVLTWPAGLALARDAGLARSGLARSAGLARGAPGGVAEATVALTFDDVPGLTILPDQAYVDRFNADLLAGLKRHHFPATGFVNAGKLDDLVPQRQIATLKTWAAAGMTLGNHTYSHESPNTLGADAYIADIQRGEPVIRSVLAPRHQPLRWFRHPYLETGATAPQMQEIDGWLAAHGYRVAPVTIDADDWEFAEPYDDAINRKDEARRQAIRAEYLDYTEAMIDWSKQSAHALFGRDIAYVMMLHDSRLNADCIDDIAALLKRHHLKPVTLARAVRDPAYRTPTRFEGPDGIEWLERWSLALNKPLPWENFRDMPQDIVTDYNRVDSDGK
jgi:peptidoglycan/xylan/chitin deacetylase (PgdA/CDA1 family)